MQKLRTLGVAALSFAMSAALAQGPKSGTAGDAAWIVGLVQAGHELHDSLADTGLFSAPHPGSSAPLLHPTSFSALAGPLQYLPFDGLAGPHDSFVPAFAEMRWDDLDFPPKGGIGHGRPVTEPMAPPRPIPEPNVYALLLAGLAAGAWASRRRKR